MEILIKFCSNRIVQIISNFLPILIVVNHFTDSLVVAIIIFFVFRVIATLSNFDVPLTILFSILGCVWVLSDGYYEWMIVLYMVFVVPKLLLLALAIAGLQK